MKLEKRRDYILAAGCVCHEQRKGEKGECYVCQMHNIATAIEASARAIMEKFVFKVDSGMARSKETYAEMKGWLDG